MEISKDSNSIDSKNKIKEVIRELLAEIVAEGHNFKVGDEVKFNGDYDGVVVKVHTSGKLKGHIDVQKKGRTSQVTLDGRDKREVRLAESISEEGGANIDASALSSLEQQLAVGLINTLGHGSHPVADVKGLKYFKVDYLADIVAKNKSRLRGDVKKHIAKLLKKLSVAMKEAEVDEVAMANTEYSKVHNKAKVLTKKANSSMKLDHIVNAIKAHKEALKLAKSSTNKAAHSGHIRDLSKKIVIADCKNCDENKFDVQEPLINEAMSDYDFLIDQLSNAMEHYSNEREFAKFMSDDTKYDEKTLTKLFKAYWKVNAKDRFEMETDIGKMKKFLAKLGIKK